MFYYDVNEFDLDPPHARSGRSFKGPCPSYPRSDPSVAPTDFGITYGQERRAGHSLNRLTDTQAGRQTDRQMEGERDIVQINLFLLLLLKWHKCL